MLDNLTSPRTVQAGYREQDNFDAQVLPQRLKSAGRQNWNAADIQAVERWIIIDKGDRGIIPAMKHRIMQFPTGIPCPINDNTRLLGFVRLAKVVSDAKAQAANREKQKDRENKRDRSRD